MKCSLCDMEFNLNSKMVEHLYNHLEDKEKEIGRLNELNRILKEETDDYSCDNCGIVPDLKKEIERLKRIIDGHLVDDIQKTNQIMRLKKNIQKIYGKIDLEK